MTPRPGLVATALCAVLLAGCARDPAPEPPAERVLLGGIVYTADASRSLAEALAVRDGGIVAVGSDEQIRGYIGEATEVHELGGRMVLPGLHDLHIHPLGIVQPDLCDLQNEPVGLAELAEFVADCLARYAPAPGEWLPVLQWNFAAGNQPSKRYPALRTALDAVSTEHPIILYGSDGHHGAVNSAALARARDPAGNLVGINRETIDRYFADQRIYIATDARGEPTGGLHENARALVDPPSRYGDLFGPAGAEELLPQMAARLAESGITTIQEAATSPQMVELFAGLAAAGKMTFRMRTALFIDPEEIEGWTPIEAIPAMVEQFSALRDRYSSERLQVDGVKLFADGVLEGDPFASPPTLPNSAVLERYQQPMFRVDGGSGTVDVTGYVDLDGEACRTYRADPAAHAAAAAVAAFVARHGHLPGQCESSRGVLENEPEVIREFVRQMTEAGFHVHIHAIGDRAVREAVAALTAAAPAAAARGLSQSLAHVQLAHPDDQKRLGAAGIAVAFTYAWAVADTPYDMTVMPFIDRLDGRADLYDPAHYYLRNAYPAASIQRYGGLLIAGSDAPVDTRDPRPFGNIAAAVFREGPDGVLNAEERIGIHEAIAAYTINGARVMGHADRLGSLEPGKLADLIVIDRNIVELARQGRGAEIAATRVELTMVEGEVVYAAGD